MNKIIIFLLFLLCLCNTLLAQTRTITIHGIVLSAAAGKSLPNIKVSSLDAVDTTDSFGRYSLTIKTNAKKITLMAQDISDKANYDTRLDIFITINSIKSEYEENIKLEYKGLSVQGEVYEIDNTGNKVPLPNAIVKLTLHGSVKRDTSKLDGFYSFAINEEEVMINFKHQIKVSHSHYHEKDSFISFNTDKPNGYDFELKRKNQNSLPHKTFTLQVLGKSNGKGIKNAYIYINGSYRGITDKNGFFSFDYTTADNNTINIEVKHPSYESIQQLPASLSQENIKISLESSSQNSSLIELRYLNTIIDTGSTIDLGNSVGSQLLSMKLKIVNVGSSKITIDKINLPFTSSEVQDITLSPTEQHEFTINFSPTHLGTFYDSLLIESDDIQQPLYWKVVATHTIEPPRLVVKYVNNSSPIPNDEQPNIDYGTRFGKILSGCGKQSFQWDILNMSSQSNLLINDVISSNADNFKFSISKKNIPPLQKATLTITFEPTTVGFIDGNLTIFSNDPILPTFILNLGGDAEAFNNSHEAEIKDNLKEVKAILNSIGSGSDSARITTVTDVRINAISQYFDTSNSQVEVNKGEPVHLSYPNIDTYLKKLIVFRGDTYNKMEWTWEPLSIGCDAVIIRQTFQGLRKNGVKEESIIDKIIYLDVLYNVNSYGNTSIEYKFKNIEIGAIIYQGTIK